MLVNITLSNRLSSGTCTTAGASFSAVSGVLSLRAAALGWPLPHANLTRCSRRSRSTRWVIVGNGRQMARVMQIMNGYSVVSVRNWTGCWTHTHRDTAVVKTYSNGKWRTKTSNYQSVIWIYHWPGVCLRSEWRIHLHERLAIIAKLIVRRLSELEAHLQAMLMGFQFSSNVPL